MIFVVLLEPSPTARTLIYMEYYFSSIIGDVVVQFYPWFKFNFPLFQIHYHTLQYPKTKKTKFELRIKLNNIRDTVVSG